MLFGLYKIVEPTERGFIERFGKPHRYVTPGGYWVIPIIERMHVLDTKEFKADVARQEIITKDRLNLMVDAQIYFKVKEDEASVFKALYKVNNYGDMISNLARTTMRNIIGNMSFEEANSNRNVINKELMDALISPSSSWGLELARAEVSSIEPPRNVQEAMNNIINAESQKKAAKELADAAVLEAEGKRASSVKQAEGNKQNAILVAEGASESAKKLAEGEAAAVKIRALAQAEAIKKVNEATEESFTPKVQLMKRLEVTQAAMQNNSKIFVPAGTDLTMLIGDTGGIAPLISKK